MRVRVDRQLCMGSGTCLATAPALFDMGDDGTADPVAPLVAPSAVLDAAVSRCPTGAIQTLPG
ncbi:ferredoxin [Mycobacterium sp. Y57]|nr:ferredoxin [Mycolicibacterium xanthum]